jgi:hypothetical protein
VTNFKQMANKFADALLWLHGQRHTKTSHDMILVTMAQYESELVELAYQWYYRASTN